jgi:hypothetical protein
VLKCRYSNFSGTDSICTISAPSKTWYPDVWYTSLCPACAWHGVQTDLVSGCSQEINELGLGYWCLCRFSALITAAMFGLTWGRTLCWRYFSQTAGHPEDGRMELVPETKNFHTLTWLSAQEDFVESLEVPKSSDVVVYDCSFCIMWLTRAKKNHRNRHFLCFQLQTPLICELVGLRKAHTIWQDPEADASFV